MAKRNSKKADKLDLTVPSVWRHVGLTFAVIFGNWRLFLALMVLVVGLEVLILVSFGGESYTKLVAGIEVMIFLLVWLTTIYLLRQKMAKHKVKLRDGLYNAMGPMVPTLLISMLVLLECLPILVLIVAYSAAVQTNLFATPFYTLVFIVFAVAMVMLAGYLLSGSLMALVAVSAPGLYPAKALKVSSELMTGRRIRFMLRLLVLVILLAVLWVVVMLPILGADTLLKQFEWAAGLQLMTFAADVLMGFSVMYVSAYLYLYYRWLLDGEKSNAVLRKRGKK